MKIEDDLKLHTHYIEELYMGQETLRGRTHDMKEKLAVQGYILDEVDKNMINMVKNQKELSEMLDKINLDLYRRSTPIDFIREILSNPRSWAFIVGLIFTIEITMGASNVLKHFLRLI